MGVSERKFGVLPDGEQVKMFHLENKSGAYVEVTDFGALLVKVCVPDKDGKLTDVVLGYDDLESYEVNGCFFGAVIGRSGNRIAGAKFSLYGKEVTLAQNENDNNLHSGGFICRNHSAEIDWPLAHYEFEIPFWIYCSPKYIRNQIGRAHV